MFGALVSRGWAGPLDDQAELGREFVGRLDVALDALICQ